MIRFWWSPDPLRRVYPIARPLYLWDRSWTEAFVVRLFKRRRLFVRIKRIGTFHFEVHR